MRLPDLEDAAVGDRLRRARAEARTTQAEAAVALGIPRSAVSDLETGTRRLAATELAKCAVLYRRPATWFLNIAPETTGDLSELAFLVATLSRADQETVIQFAGFLAARQAT
jgi:transcriptional regulator with XRE-family HTH domain